MATKQLLCVEPDENVLRAIRGSLEPLGFEIVNITGGDEAVAWGRANMPALVIVSVEPRKMGYAICNKFKRAKELKDIPLILTSSDETPQQLEQHRKLKVKANEYLTKPFSDEDLVAKVDAVYQGQDPVSDLDDDLMVEEISIDDADIVEEDLDAEDASFDAAVPTVAGTLEAFESEADAAFEAIRADGAAGAGGTPQRDASDDQSSPWNMDDAEWDAAADAATAIEEVGDGPVRVSDAAIAVVGAAAELLTSSSRESFDEATRAISNPQALVASMLQVSDDEPGATQHETPAIFDDQLGADRSRTTVPLAPESDEPEAEAEAAEAEAEAEALQVLADDAEADATFDAIPAAEIPNAAAEAASAQAAAAASSAQLASLQSEIERLRAENAELKARPAVASAGVNPGKEILGLKQIINKKEQEILDLNDRLDQKERQVLDNKDRLREHERERRSLEENSLNFEKNLMAANERIEAILQDKERATERERGLKVRLEDAHNEISKAHEEIESLKKRNTANEERLRAESDRLRGELEGRVLHMEDAHRAELEKLSEERATAEAALDQEHQAELGQLQESHATALQDLQRKADAAKAEDAARSRTEIERVLQEKDQAVASAKEEQARQITAEREAHETALHSKEQDHKNEFLGMRSRHEEELAASDERRRAELKQRDEAHHAEVAEMDRRQFQEKTEVSERHRQEIDQAMLRVANTEGELAARTEELAEGTRRLAGVHLDLDTAKSELRERDVKLNQTNNRIAELETKTGEYEEQIMRAYKLMKSDEQVVTKAKRALAVALSLLEERGTQPESSEAAGASPEAENVAIGTDENAGETSS